MIRILNENEQPLRLIDSSATEVAYFDRYGFVTPLALDRRRKMRRHVGVGVGAADDRSEFDFSIYRESGQLRARAVNGCAIVQQNEGRWQLQSERGLFFIEDFQPLPVNLAPLPPVQRSWLPILSLVVAALLPFFLASYIVTPKVEKKSSEASEAPVILRAPAPPQPVKEASAAPDPQAKARKIVNQQLGFLSLMGKKDFRKAAGGLPTPSAKVTSPGAGPGGAQGSGGELVAGMGRGLHQTTVGNTGVSGLGGLGTKGAGGGQGGYGDTEYGGGAGGQVLSAIPLAQDAKVDEGLDRSQIQATIMRYLSQVRACYEEGLKRNQALIGQITMAFEIGAQGQVLSSNVQRSSLSDRPVEDCVQTKMLTWKFPQPRGGVSVKASYPFMLRPIRQ